MRTLIAALIVSSIFAIAGLRFTGSQPTAVLPTAYAQDSRPKADEPEKKGPAGVGEKESAGKNPLDDPKWQQNAKLGKLIAKKRCVICHKIDGKGGVLSPPMEEVTPKRFNAMEKYGDYVQTLKGQDPARYRASKEKIDSIVNENDRYQQLILWLQSYLKKPTFDNGKAKMTPQSLKPVEVEQIIAYLLTLEPKKTEKKKE